VGHLEASVFFIATGHIAMAMATHGPCAHPCPPSEFQGKIESFSIMYKKSCLQFRFTNNSSTAYYLSPSSVASPFPSEISEQLDSATYNGCCIPKMRPCLVRKNFQDSPSHRISSRMHGTLKIDKNKN